MINEVNVNNQAVSKSFYVEVFHKALAEGGEGKTSELLCSGYYVQCSPKFDYATMLHL